MSETLSHVVDVNSLIYDCEVSMFNEDETTAEYSPESLAACRRLANQFEADMGLTNQGFLATAISEEKIYESKANTIIFEDPTFFIETEEDDSMLALSCGGLFEAQYVDIIPGQTPVTDIKKEPPISYWGPHILCLFELPENGKIDPGIYFVAIPFRNAQIWPRQASRGLN